MSDININSIEPNSHAYKAEKAKAEEAKASRKPIIDRDQIVSTKKPVSKKFLDRFLSEDIDDIKKWLIMDVVIPGVKNVILDGLCMMFFGEVDSRSRGRGGYRNDGRTNYRGYYSGSSSSGRRSSNYKRDERYDSDDRVDFRNIILRRRDDAERLIDELRDRIHKSGSVSVAELLDLIDVPGRYTDNNWGWDDERDIGIKRVSSGFLINVSEPRYLD